MRDQGGVTLSQRLDAMEAPDDRTIVLRLNKPFPHLRTLLSKFIIPAVMMPERLAQTDPFKQIPEAIGSGPFRWLADEHVLGSHAAFAKFDRYVPRDEPASYTAGGHRVLVDRVEWKMIPDGADRGQRADDRRGGLDRDPAARSAADVEEGVAASRSACWIPTARSVSCGPTTSPRRPAILACVVRCWPRSTSRR